MSIRTYIAGPLFGSGRSTENLHNALRVAEAVRAWRPRAAEPAQGLRAMPFVPHLFSTWDQIFPHSDENYWLDMDKVWLQQCHVLIVIPGVSPGTRKEERWAEEETIYTRTLPTDWKNHGETVLNLAVATIFDNYLTSGSK